MNRDKVIEVLEKHISILHDYGITNEIREQEKEVFKALDKAISMAKENGELRVDNDCYKQDRVTLKELQKENGELRKENDSFKDTIRMMRLGNEQDILRLTEVEQELTELKEKQRGMLVPYVEEIAELKAKYEEVEQTTGMLHEQYVNKCEELADLKKENEELGKECDMATDRYEYLNDCCIKYNKQIADLKKAVASEGLGVEDLMMIIRPITCNGCTDCENSPDCPEDYDGCISLDIATSIHEAQTKYKKEKGE